MENEQKTQPMGDYKGRKDKILAYFMFGRVYTRWSMLHLMYLSGVPYQSCYKILNKLEEKEYLATGNIKIKVRSNTKSITFLYLDKKGIEYIKNHPNNFPVDLFDEITNLAVKPFLTKERGQKRKKYISKETTALTLAYLAGATISSDVFTTVIENEIDGKDNNDSSSYDLTNEANFEIDDGDGDEIEDEVIPDDEPDEEDKGKEKTDIKHFLIANLTEEAFQNFNLFPVLDNDPDHLINFHTGVSIKINAAQSNTSVSIRDYINNRYQGALDSHYKSMFMYVAPELYCKWGEVLPNKEIAAYKHWLRNYAIAPPAKLRKNGQCACFVVENVKKFIRLYNNEDAPNKKAKIGLTYGSPFQHLYIVPRSEEGVHFLNWLMLHDDDVISQQLIDFIVQFDNYTRTQKSRTGTYDNLFPICHSSGRSVAIGVFLDAMKMNMIADVARKLPNSSFEIICMEWQRAYYAGIMPDNVCVTTTSSNEFIDYM